MAAPQDRIQILLLSLIAAVVGFAALREAYFVALPLVLAFFVTVLVWPLNAALLRRLPRRHRWVAIVTTMLVVVAALGAFAGGAWYMVYRVVRDRFPEAAEALRDAQERLGGWLTERGLSPEEEGGWLVSAVMEWAQTTAVTATELLAGLGLTLFFVLLMLIEAGQWKETRARAAPAERAARVGAAVGAITTQVRVFLAVQLVVASMTAAATALWLWAMGVPLVPLWAALTFVLDFVPNIGPVLAVSLVTLVALATLDTGGAVAVGIGGLLIQNLFGNFIDPRLKGRHMSISPLVVLVSVVFWAWLWGPVGAVIGVPLTATAIIAMAHVRPLRPVALLLSRNADWAKLDEQAQSGAEAVEQARSEAEQARSEAVGAGR